MYKASKELVEIFLKNGFTEVTEKVYPEHVNRLNKEGYNPHRQKRKFVFGTTGRNRNSVLFDYISITPYRLGGCQGGDSKLELTEDELKSILTFYKLSTASQSAYGKAGGRVIELHTRYKRICENPEWHNKKSDRELKMVFESVSV